MEQSENQQWIEDAIVELQRYGITVNPDIARMYHNDTGRPTPRNNSPVRATRDRNRPGRKHAAALYRAAANHRTG